MKNTLFISFLLFLFFSIMFLWLPSKSPNTSSELQVTNNNSAGTKTFVPEVNNSELENSNEGPEVEIKYFKKWHEPFGNVLSPLKLKKMWSAVNRLPDEKQMNPNLVNSWISEGPYGMNVLGSSGTMYSGRILDIELTTPGLTRIGAASGGLWGLTGTTIVPISDNLSSQVIGSFCTKPGDVNTIIAGTGEYNTYGGTGIFLTSNGGTSWLQSSLNTGIPYTVFKIRYNTQNTSQIFAASDLGFFRSDDGGLTFNQKLQGVTTDLLIGPNISGMVWTSVWNDGLYLSSNNGDNWTRVSGGGYPSSDIGRTSLGIASNGSTNYLISSIAKNSDNSLLGIYISYNNGSSWSNISPSYNIFNQQGWYDNIIAGSPTVHGVVIAGGVVLWRSTDFGNSWAAINDANDHPDQHAIAWDNNGSVWVGNDGGMTVSNDAGVTWNTSKNTFPITQYYNIGVGGNTSNNYSGIIFGGAQDNGISGTTNNGSVWAQTAGGDGGGVCIDPNNQNMIFCTDGVFGGYWSFQRLVSSDYGVNWTFSNNGIDPNSTFDPKIRNDQVPQVFLFNNSGPYVYESQDYVNWTKLNTTAFASDVFNLNVAIYSGGEVIYASLNSVTSGQILEVNDEGNWYERSAGLYPNTTVRSVAQHPTDNNVAYALMNGLGFSQKIFATTNRGVNWTDITGDMPDIPMADLVPHPTDPNTLYLGTEMGCYKTTSGGQNWIRWNNGMPAATIVTEMSYIDSTAANGKFYIVAGTFGRGVWIRDISGDDPIGIHASSGNLPAKFSLYQNYPNPFNPISKIKYQIAKLSFVTLKVYDVLGREVATLVNEKRSPGTYEATFDGSNLATGVYFYKLTAGSFISVKKLVLLK